MFYYLSGKVALTLPNAVVIDCGGVGYACLTSRHTLQKLSAGENATLYTYLYVREDVFDLYGFADPEELNCFKMLIGISGIGPKAAVSILSTTTPAGFALSVLTGDEKLLSSAPGIGKKTAQRIILELSDKLAKAQPAATAATTLTDAPSGNIMAEALNALLVLEYSRAEALEALRTIDPVGLTVEEVIRQALKKLIR